jgi:hypothetical protein
MVDQRNEGDIEKYALCQGNGRQFIKEWRYIVGSRTIPSEQGRSGYYIDY